MRPKKSPSVWQRLQDCPLSLQLIAPMMLVGSICLFAAIYSAFKLQDSVGELGRVYSSSDRRLQVIDSIESGVTAIRALSLRHLASENYGTMQEIHAELDAVILGLLQDIDEVSAAGYSDDPDFIEGRVRLSGSVRDYLGHVRTIMKLSEDFEKESAFVELTASDNNHLPSVTESLREMKRHAFENVMQLRQQLAADASRNLNATIAFGITGIGLLTLISLLVMRRVTLRISHLLQWTREVSSGNLDAPLLADSEDEVGNLTRSKRVPALMKSPCNIPVNPATFRLGTSMCFARPRFALRPGHYAIPSQARCGCASLPQMALRRFVHPCRWTSRLRHISAFAIPSIRPDATPTGDYPPSLRSPWRAADEGNGEQHQAGSRRVTRSQT